MKHEDSLYKYALDQTSTGPDAQWQTLKHLLIDNYKAPDKKIKRLHVEKCVRENEVRVAEETKIGPRADNLSAWDAVLSEDEECSEPISTEVLITSRNARSVKHLKKVRRRNVARTVRREDIFEELDEDTPTGDITTLSKHRLALRPQ